MPKPTSNLLWLQSGGCGGCSMSLLGAESPDLLTTLASVGIKLIGHPVLGEASGQSFHSMLKDILAGKMAIDILCLEGTVVHGPNGSGRFHLLAGTDQPMRDWIAKLAGVSKYVVAVGSCAAYGGITAGGGNPSESTGLQYDGEYRGGLLGEAFVSTGGLPVINISGCAAHPGWITETLMQLAIDDFGEECLDELGRPRSYADQLVHHGCPRNEYYEFKASASKPSQLGCLMEHLGCIGTQAHGDCNTRLWNGEGSCLRGGFSCINCTAPVFEEPGHEFMQTPKIGGIPMGLPIDMPKAWFVALASLSKAATPERLKQNATSEQARIAPAVKLRRKH